MTDAGPTRDGRLSDFAKRLFGSLYEELQALDQRILAMESEINQAFQQNALCQRIGEVEGIGPVTATAVIAAISNVIADNHNSAKGQLKIPIG